MLWQHCWPTNVQQGTRSCDQFAITTSANLSCRCEGTPAASSSSNWGSVVGLEFGFPALRPGGCLSAPPPRRPTIWMQIFTIARRPCSRRRGLGLSAERTHIGLNGANLSSASYYGAGSIASFSLSDVVVKNSTNSASNSLIDLPKACANASSNPKD